MTKGIAGIDQVVALLFVIVLVLLVSGLTGAHWVFAYALVTWLGVLAGIGFIRPGDRRTWLAALLVFLGLALGMTGVLVNESVIVTTTADTVLGFHPGTASLVYGIWIPALFTIGLAFVLLFDRLIDSGNNSR
ncbi:MAG: hypothetical protein OEW64_02240 [Gammaproteobacteria bacterium]|nr:hypothetical protein [Gammaproteobacteria bacterium]MDH5302900.1 hypothetical protein [Gammaproteobacteria bacterium]MDH5321005.1 hypothetical protein [Gammaproteobacteria bacterium]